MDGQRALYLSSSIGLGHASKDLAIAAELRRSRPDIDIVWLAGEPAAQALRQAGERVLPEAARWASASLIAEKCFRDGRLDLVRYIYRSLPSWARNARVVAAAVKAHDVDVVIGDEAWEVDVPLVAHMMRLPVPFVLITDFCGVDALSGGLIDRAGAWLLNWLWEKDKYVYRNGRHAGVFVGEIEDIPEGTFGWALPDRRRHARGCYRFVGYATAVRAEEYGDRAAWRRRLGLPDGPLVVCSAGGTSIGRRLLEVCGAAFGPLRERLPGAHLLVVCGPRIDPHSMRLPEDVEVRGYVPRLYEVFAACDVAVVQCGSSSTTELAALGRPFIYVPIEGHYEQEAVASRLARHGAGRRMSLATMTPATLAAALVEEYGRGTVPGTLPVGGAVGAAEQILATLDRAAAQRGRAAGKEAS